MWDTCTSHFGPKKFDRVGRGGQGMSKSAPESPDFGFGAVQPEAPELINDPLKGPKMVPPTVPDWLESMSWPFKALRPLFIKKYRLSYIVKSIGFWNFNFFPRISDFSTCIVSPKKVLEEKPNVNFSRWPHKLGSPFALSPLGKFLHGTP